MQNIRNVGIIALNTFRESVRNKVLYNIVFLAIALAFFSIILGEMQTECRKKQHSRYCFQRSF